jgi:hypothetical protein
MAKTRKKSKKKAKKKVSKKTRRKVTRKLPSVSSMAKSKTVKQLLTIRDRAGKALLVKARTGKVKPREGILAGLFAGPRRPTPAIRKKEAAVRAEQADLARRMEKY